MRIELVPDLSHCVQTRARQEYTTVMSQKPTSAGCVGNRRST